MIVVGIEDTSDSLRTVAGLHGLLVVTSYTTDQSVKRTFSSDYSGEKTYR